MSNKPNEDGAVDPMELMDRFLEAHEDNRNMNDIKRFMVVERFMAINSVLKMMFFIRPQGYNIVILKRNGKMIYQKVI